MAGRRAAANDSPAGRAPGADFRAAAVRLTQDRRPGIDGPAIAFTLLLNRISVAHQVESERLVHRPHGWTYSGFRVLYMIWLLQPVEARDLARFAGVSRQTTSTVLSTLESAKLIKRKQTSKTDRRLVSVRLTPRGQEAVEQAIAEQNALESDWFGALTAVEQGDLLGMLDRVLARMHEPEAGADLEPDMGVAAAGR